MTADQAPPITLPALTLITLADLLTELDEFLRSGVIAEELTGFLAGRSRGRPGFAARNLIDEVSFTAVYLRGLTHGTFGAAAECALLADHTGGESPQDS